MKFTDISTVENFKRPKKLIIAIFALVFFFPFFFSSQLLANPNLLSNHDKTENPETTPAEAPALTINCPFTMVISCDESTHPDNTGYATATDNCQPAALPIDITWTDNSSQGNAFCAQYSYFITRTWTAVSECDGTMTCNQLIQVLDDSAPIITCPADTNMECSDNPNPALNPGLGVATAIDNCSANNEIDIYFIDTTDQGFTDCDPFDYTITRTWYASDICGNMNTCVQMIAVSDNTAPDMVCPAVIVLSCENSSDPAVTGTPVVTDNCDPFVQPTFQDELIPGTACAGNYTINRTWTAEDDCGNTNTCQQQINFIDTSGPSIMCPPNSIGVLACTESIPDPATTVAELIAMGATVSDNCSADDDLIVLSSVSNNGGTNCPGNAYSIVRTYTVIDECGNGSTCNQTFTYAESFTGPMITNIAPTCYKYCASLINEDVTDVEFTTECNLGATVEISDPVITGIADCPGASYTYTYTVTDDCGRTATAQRIFFIGNNEPTISCPPFNLILNCGDPNNDDYIAAHLDLVSANSSCELGLTISNNYSPQPNLFCATPNLVTSTATDDCGRSVSCETTITILDNTSPVITNVPPSVCDETECNDDIDYWFTHWIDYMLTGLVAEDECGNVTWTTIPANPVVSQNCNVNGKATTLVTFVATDDCTNSSIVTGTFVVNNEYPASFANVPGDQTISCDATAVFGPAPTIVDGCQTTLSHVDATDDTDPCAILMTRTWTATDACGGLTTSLTQTITLIDNTGPQITGGADTTAECDGQGNSTDFDSWAVSNAGATASDDCNGVIWTNDYSSTNWVDTPNCAGGVVAYVDVTFTATDACDNSNSTTHRFNIEDTTEPVFTSVPSGGTVECSVDAVFETPTATDICNTVNITSSDNSTGDNCTGTITRTWTATDACGNTSTASATINYSDTQPPTASNVPANGTIACEETVVFGADPTWTDNCDANLTITIADSTTPGDCPNEYIAIRTWTAEDNCGNTAAVSQNIEVVDITVPLFTFVSPDGAVDCIDFVMFEDATAVDNCGPVTITHTDATNGDDCIGSVTRTWTAEDECGSTATASATITYNDNVSPIFTFVPNNSFVECADDAIFEIAVAADLCGVVTMTTNDVTTGDNCVGSIVRTWTATDECGNSATASATIEYADFQPPTVSNVPASVTISCDEPMVFGPEPTFTDNCDDAVTVTFQDIETPGDCANGGFLYTMERIWTGTDNCGFSAIANQTITVIDDEAPYFTFVPSDGSASCNNNPVFEDAQAEDNCGNVTITFEDETTGSNCSLTVTRTWTATDDCGLTATVSATINGGDDEPPVWTYVPPVKDVDCDENLDFEIPEVEDNCGNVELTWEEDVNGELCDAGYAKSRIWTATDGCGNSSTVETTVWVNPDTEGPEFTFVPDGDLITCDEFPPTFGEPVVTDDCGSVTLTFIDEYIGNPNGCDEGENFDYRRVWTATDDCGNSSTAKQTFWVKYEEPASANIMGLITNEENEAVESVVVSLEGAVTDSYQTIEDGLYDFSGLPIDNNYSITPVLDENPLNGVSSFDLILMTKHLLNIEHLNSPYKLIAADVNNSGSVSTLDILELRKLILYVDTELSNNTSWRFVEANFVFPQATNPFATIFPEMTSINGLMADEQQDYVGVKVGDVNNSATANNLMGGDGRDFNGELAFELKDQLLLEGESYEIAFKTKDFIEVMGFQYSLKFNNNALQFEGLTPGVFPAMGMDNFGFSHLDEGIITTSWTHNQPQSMLDEAVLFTVRFTAKQDARLSELLNISSLYTAAEAYVKGTSSGGVDFNSVLLRFEGEEIENDHFELYQNTPNPFFKETTIGFNLPEATNAVLTIYNVNGTVVQQISKDYEKGYNEEVIQLKEGLAGVYYYRLVTPQRHLSMKMIFIRL